MAVRSCPIQPASVSCRSNLFARSGLAWQSKPPEGNQSIASGRWHLVSQPVGPYERAVFAWSQNCLMSLPDGWHGAGIIHESGQAWVYQVRRRDDSEDGPLFALKRLKNPSRRERFAREVAAMERLRRDRGVAVPDVIERDLHAERPWFVMPWYGGGSLEQAVDDARYRTDELGGVTLLIELAQVIADVHAAGLAHRDVKPSNVLFGESGLVLADFGLCLDIEDDQLRLTDAHEAIGSRLYIAPENEAGINQEVDQRPADAYAFGKLAWAVLAGRRPLPRETVLERENSLAVLLNEPRLAAVDGLLRDLLSRDPRARLVDWELVLRDLRAVERQLAGRDEESGRPSVSDRARSIARRVAQLPQVEAAVTASDDLRHREEWSRRAVTAMHETARIADAALIDLTRELGDLLTLTVTSGGAPSRNQLAKSRIADLSLEAAQLLPGSDHTGAAACFVIHSPRGIPAFATLVVRTWLSMEAGQVWVNRLPMVTKANEPDAVATFLAPALATRAGPYPPYRQATINEAVRVIEETARLFVTLCEHYLDIIDRGGDPANPREWEGREIVPAEAAQAEEADRGDTQPPDLRSFEVIPTAVQLKGTEVSITCRARIVDDAAGVAGVGFTSSPSQARFRSPSGQFADVMFNETQRIAGDALDGVYEDSFVLSPRAERGFWIVESVLVVDQVGNARRYSTVDLRDRGMPTRLEVR